MQDNKSHFIQFLLLQNDIPLLLQRIQALEALNSRDVDARLADLSFYALRATNDFDKLRHCRTLMPFVEWLKTNSMGKHHFLVLLHKL